MWVSPFRYPRIVAYLQLPAAFRSLSRLSSALSAQASTLRSFQLNLSTRVRVCSLIYARSVGRLGLGSSMFTNLFLIHCSFDNNSCYAVAPRFWMSLSFNSLRSIMILHYLFVFGFQGTFLSSSDYQVSDISQWDSQIFDLLNATSLRFHVASHYTSA